MTETDGSAPMASAALRRAVMGELLAETLDLMNQMERLASARRAALESPGGAALVLRLSTRLAAVGGWLLLAEHEDEDAARTLDPAEVARRSEMLERAEFGPLDAMVAPPALAEAARRVDALVNRALRLDRAAGGRGADMRSARARRDALSGAAAAFRGALALQRE